GRTGKAGAAPGGAGVGIGAVARRQVSLAPPSVAVSNSSSRRRPGSTLANARAADKWVPAFAGTTVLGLGAEHEREDRGGRGRADGGRDRAGLCAGRA